MEIERSDRDRRLVARFLTGREERAFRELYRRHAPSLNQLIARFVGMRNGDTEDVIQATWIRAIENLGEFRWESNLRTWLTGIALNCSREHMRRRRRDQGCEWMETADVSESPRINQAINRIDLERAIALLPDGYREVLILHDVEGYTHDEIARFLGIESGTSKSQLSRARRAVRAKLAETDGYGND